MNHKLFFLFLLYSTAGLLSIATLLAYTDIKKGHLALFIPTNLALGIGIGTLLLLIAHTVFIAENWTSIECGYLWSNNIYRQQSFGHKWRLIFGQNRLTWLLPITSTDPLEALDYKASIPVRGVIKSLEEVPDDCTPLLD